MEFIFDFVQAKITSIHATVDGKDITVDMNDLLILDYIVNAYCSKTMEHTVVNGMEYVWINRTKLLHDLPILQISANRVSHLFDKLEVLGLIETKQMSTKGLKGSRCYINITDLLLSCMNTNCDNYFKILDVKNNTSDNTYNITIDNICNIKDKDISELLKITPNRNKPKKLSLYDKCVLEIEKFTDDENLKDVLVKYLNVRIKLSGKSFGLPIWVNILGKLKTLDNQIKVVEQATEKKWASVYEYKDYTNKGNASNWDCNRNVRSVKMTKEDELKLQKSIEERKRNGQQVEF